MFKTADIVLAATLRVKQYELLDIEKIGNKGTFCFQNIPSEVIADYDLGKCQVEPVEFNNIIKQLTTAARR